MTYATETRAETTATKQMLKTTEMRILRSITDHTLRDRKRNEEVRSICDPGHSEMVQSQKKGHKQTS